MNALRRFGCLLPAILLLAPGCGQSGPEAAPVTSPEAPPAADWVYRPPEQVNDGWETASLESVGMDVTPFSYLMSMLHGRSGHRVHGILIVRHGKLVFEEYFDGLSHPTFGEQPVSFDRETWHCLSSVAKSFTATLLGLAIDRGFIVSADQSVFDFFPELVDLEVGPRRGITLEHLVTMTSGLEWDESSRSLRDPLNDLTAWLTLTRTTSQDPVRAVLEKPMVAAPGTLYRYGGGNTNVLGKAIQNAVGQRLDGFAREALFAALGIDDVWWWVLRDDFVYASGDITLRPRDMAKFGLMYLNGGVWNGQRILSPEWVEASASAYTAIPTSDPHHGQNGFAAYSYGWWIKSDDFGRGVYEASGWGGQAITILPELDMVVVFTGGSYWEAPAWAPHEMLRGYVLPSVG
jgi:CubicO group peptidase (beta-lactamase class C family)